MASIEEVHAEGEGPLAQLFDLILFGDVMSLAMADHAGVDPGPIAALDFIKAIARCARRLRRRDHH